MNIYIPIEVKARELEGRSLLALVAAERGHTVILGEKKDTLNLAKDNILPPGIVHDKSLTPGDYKIEYFSKLKEFGHLITAQDEESGLLDESFDHFAKRRFSEETVSRADKIFAWGEHDAGSLQKIYPDHADIIVPTGSPRVDFWRSELDGFYQEDSDVEYPQILIASNFGSPIDENPFWNRIARLRKAGYFDRDPDMEKYVYENTAYQFRLLYCFVDMIRSLAVTFPNTKIMVRPHPVESIEAWKKLVGECSNVTIRREGTISGWIRNTSILIHNGCTSALEAAVSGLPRIAYRPIPNEIEREIPNNTSIQAFSIDELKSLVADILDKKSNKEVVKAERAAAEITGKRLSSLNGTFAAERIVDEWELLGKSAGMIHSSSEDLIRIKSEYLNNLNRGQFLRSLKRKAAKMRNRMFKDYQKNAASDGKLLNTAHKFPSLSDKEMDDIINNLRITLDRFHDIKAVRYGEKSFIFSKK